MLTPYLYQIMVQSQSITCKKYRSFLDYLSAPPCHIIPFTKGKNYPRHQCSTYLVSLFNGSISRSSEGSPVFGSSSIYIFNPKFGFYIFGVRDQDSSLFIPVTFPHGVLTYMYVLMSSNSSPWKVEAVVC